MALAGPGLPRALPDPPTQRKQRLTNSPITKAWRRRFRLLAVRPPEDDDLTER
jgi:hypothetical protein